MEQKTMFCTTCGKNVEAQVRAIRLPNYIEAYVGSCPVCGNKVMRKVEEDV